MGLHAVSYPAYNLIELPASLGNCMHMELQASYGTADKVMNREKWDLWRIMSSHVCVIID